MKDDAPPKVCPICGLYNPPTGERCDCGYDFKSLVIEDSYVASKDRENARASRSEPEVFHFDHEENKQKIITLASLVFLLIFILILVWIKRYMS